MKTNNLIVPIAADKPEYEHSLPHIFEADEQGTMLCVKSILGLNLDNFENIWFTILRKHDEKYGISTMLESQFSKLGIRSAKVVILDEPTKDQAETIYQTIQLRKITGSLFIKDADSYFEAEICPGNTIAVFPIEELDVLEPKNKSYVTIDESYYITNIIEKRVVGHHISVGGYSFESAELFCEYYDKLRTIGRLYLSHIIYSMLLGKLSFRPVIVKGYQDWGGGQRDKNVSQHTHTVLQR